MASSPSTAEASISSSATHGTPSSRSKEPSEEAQRIAVRIRRNLFLTQPTGVVMRMIKEREILLDPEAQDHVYDLLDEDPEFDISKAPVTRLMSGSKRFLDISQNDNIRATVQSNLKMLQCIQALSSVPEAINPLIKNKLASALHISNLSEIAFVEQLSDQIGDREAAISIHQHAVKSRIRNENFLVSSLQAVKGTGLRVIDGNNTPTNSELRKTSFNATADQFVTQIDLERLFGSIDLCDCAECGSVYGAASYFVELMEFLRNNNLNSKHSRTSAKDINNTQLQALLKRRPDLACIQLTCENTNTLIPYIDLALEVMESYVVHAPVITAYNVDGETSNELLCSPQHTNLGAYEVLRTERYPLGLPYHLPIDILRVFLEFLKTTRAEIIRIFQPTGVLDPTAKATTPTAITVQRSFDAEANLLTQEEYVILTKMAFSTILSNQNDCCRSEHTKKSRLRPPWEYFGYQSEAAMLDDDPNTMAGLSWIKRQFLKRTGIQYMDLVALVKTRYINPNMPTGKALTTMERIRFSYRFLTYLVQNQYRDKRRRFSKLIKFLNIANEIIPVIEEIKKFQEVDLCADPNSVDCSCNEVQRPAHQHCCCDEDEWAEWVHNWFEKIGSVIVIESGEGPRIPLRGRVWAEPFILGFGSEAARSSQTSISPLNDPVFIGELKDDGALIDELRNAIAFVSFAGALVDLEGKNLQDSYPNYRINVYPSDNHVGNSHMIIGRISGKDDALYYRPFQTRIWARVQWSTARDDCDITKSRLLHLDGTQLTPDEYFSMVRFLRLWNKLGWSIPEVDSAIVGLGKPDLTVDENSDGQAPDCSEDSDTNADIDDVTSVVRSDINPSLIHQLVAVRKLLDITSFPIEVILTFWTTIPAHGETSLYHKTFLTHNILRMDPVFQPDENGNFLTATEKISDHLAVLQTTLRLKVGDIDRIRQLRGIKDSLTIENLSELFRISTLIRFLSVRTELLPDILAVIAEPFANAYSTLSFLQTFQNIANSNLSFQELNYVIRGVDNLSRPLGPTPQAILKLGKLLLDGLTAIEDQNANVSQADIENQTVSLPDLIPAKLALIFDPVLAKKIDELINGRYVFTTNAPPGLGIVIPAAMESLTAKVQYANNSTARPPMAQLTITGILTEEEAVNLKGLTANTKWSEAVDRIKKQGVTFYKQYLALIFPPDGQSTLLAGDNAETPLTKGFYFLEHYMPFLRARLSTTMVRQTISDAMGLPLNTTAYLLNTVKASAGDSALDVLLALKQSSEEPDGANWSGYLIPSSTEKYQFWTTSETRPPNFTLDGLSYDFPNQSEDPNNIWSTSTVDLVGGRLYALKLLGTAPGTLSWSTATSPPTLIPSTALLPAIASSAVSEVLTALTKISIIIGGFTLSLDEVTYLYQHPEDFASLSDQKPLDLTKFTIGGWRRLFSYTSLRDSLPKQQTRLIDLFAWTKLPGVTDVVGEIVKLTRWDPALLTAILTGYNKLAPENFRNELFLVSVKQALEVARKTEIAVPSLFEWAKPLSLSDSSYQKLVDQADTLKKTLRSRYNATDWEEAAKPLFDTLRKHQRDALVAYLVVEPSLVATGLVDDADGLFEYFLIDCQMSSCLKTSRIKQAISTIQLYIQRCLLGLEAEVAQQEDDLIDRKRWGWMKRYRTWEANRQVFLYPENWILPSLRDDKSPFFLDLESSLQQKDITLASATASLKSYVHDVATVANLKVFGMFIKAKTSSDQRNGVHIVARRMNAPFTWFSRDYNSDGTWSPWIQMQVDIPNYDAEDTGGNAVGSGSYIAPYLWQGRPVLFFLQMSLKQMTVDNPKPLNDRMSQDSKSQSQSIPVWQINLGVSRFDNGRWTPKELSQSSLRHKADQIDITLLGTTIPTFPVPEQARYQMIPRYIADLVTGEDGTVSVQEKTASQSLNKTIGSFIFVDGGISQTLNAGSAPSINFNEKTVFQYVESSNTIFSYQIDNGTSTPQYFDTGPAVTYPSDPTAGTKSTFVASTDLSGQFTFNHTFADRFLKEINSSEDISLIYEDFLAVSKSANVAGDNPFGTVRQSGGTTSYHELMSPWGLYNWEIGLHAPMTLIDSLLHAQQFDDALTVCHTLFDPTITGSANRTSGDNSQFWKFEPFKALANTDARESLEQIFLALTPGAPDADISTWRDKPYSPHVVARSRPVAYMKWIAMKYIEILVAYGDYYFRQNSLETIPEAIQCYILASHVYGPRGQKIPRRGKKKAETYSSLLNRWDAFGNAVVQLEIEFPFSNQTSQPVGSSNSITGFANIFGFASSLYFCIPGNPKLTQLRDTIDDRLSKIRNCMDINGVVRQLPLFDPPIDPALLVAATAQGLSIDTVLNDLSGPIPNYRFQTLIAKALEICSELKSLGAALLSAKEKKDNEHLAVLRATHETVINGFQLDMKTRALEEANAVLDQLIQNREGPKYKLQFFKSLVALTDGPPGEEDDFAEVPNPSLQAPTTNGQMLLIPEENEEVNKSVAARDWNIGIGAVETLAGILHMFPDTDIEVKPFGIGTGLRWGGSFLGGSTSAVARGMQIYATTLTSDSANAGRKSGLLRALQDRILQANSSGHELKNIDKQIATQRLRVAASEQEIKNAQVAVDHAVEVEEYLRSKYTNEELYSWIEGKTRSLYNDTYNLAYDLAKRAEKTFTFERPQMATSSYIELGYFTSAREGFLAGEAMYLGLKRLEAAWQDSIGHDFELTKHISIRQWAPLSLLEFREKGTFTLDIPEILFDMDCPGHYMRRIASVNVSIPCITGPYASINCTLRLVKHSMRTTPRANSKSDYPHASEDEDDDRFQTTNVPISAVVISGAQADSGRFDAPADRYNPFEGAGAISTWSFTLPSAIHSFNYSSITDVVLTVRYTSLDGGEKLRDIASSVVADYFKTILDAGAPDGSGLFTFFDLSTDFATEWFRAGFGSSAGDDVGMNLDNVSSRLPLYASSTRPEKIVATRVALLARGSSFSASDVSLVQKMPNPSQTAQEVAFKPGRDIEPLTGIISGDDGLQLPMTSWTLKVKQGSADLQGLWMVVRYSLT
ncbi:hypothetical protein DL98DRAFT_497477 [Cadophora sp. DSE1049]|nr:hypothetical protein DL98DRAFT_497477 [Cadophora sp. DSE1049]